MANFDVLLIFPNFNLNVLGNFLGKLRTRFSILDSYKESCCPKPQVAEPLNTKLSFKVEFRHRLTPTLSFSSMKINSVNAKKDFMEVVVFINSVNK